MDWVAVLGAVGVLFTTIAGALGVWWLRILSKRQEHELKLQEAVAKGKKEDEAAKRREKKDNMDDFEALLEAQKEQIKENREEIHELRNRMAISETKEQACQIKLTRIETQYTEQVFKMKEILEYVEDLETALINAKVPIVRRRKVNDGSGVIHLKPLPPNLTGDNNG